MVNAETGEIYAEAGDEVSEQLLEELDDAGFDEVALLDIDHINTGSFIRNTLSVDKNMAREEALSLLVSTSPERPKIGDPHTFRSAVSIFLKSAGSGAVRSMNMTW